jgi:hypothetical protein
MGAKKNILVVPCEKADEALRMACGLTLLDDRVQVMSWNSLVKSDATNEQIEALEFADVAVQCLDSDHDALAKAILGSDVVFCV